MKLARWSGFLLLPIAFLLERFAWFGARSVLWEHIAGEGAAEADAASAISRALPWLVMLSPLAGAAAGYALGARRTLIIGMLTLCVGYLLLVQGWLPWPGAVVVALGVGLARPALLAVAGAVSPDPVESPRSTLFVLLYAMTLLAGLGAPAIATSVRPNQTAWLLGGAALFVLVAAALAGVHLAVVRAKGVHEPEPDPGARPGRGAVVILCALAMAITVQRLATGLLLQSRLATQLPATLHPVMVILALAIVGIVWTGLSLGRARVSAPVPVALGFLLFFVAPLPIVVAVANLGGDFQAVQGIAMLAGMAALAAGEALAMPFLLSRISAGASPRTSVASVSAWLVVTSATSALLGFAPESRLGLGIALVFAAVASFLVAIAFLVHRARFRSLFRMTTA